MGSSSLPVPGQSTRRWRLRIGGVVQGVGFRPWVYREATTLGLAGWVRNDAAGVLLEIEGPLGDLEAFRAALHESPPPMAIIDQVTTSDVAVVGETGFQIGASEDKPQQRSAVSPDLAICRDCLGELFSPGDRRYRYPFINCTHCGPRFTILRELPYDRPQTTMQAFPMCATCDAEYRDPGDRRYHAQPNACGECGPQVWYASRREAPARWDRPPPDADGVGQRGLDAARSALREGAIVAIKGLGGFHLACDATSDQAVQNLRDRKGRNDKPLAVMVDSLSACQAWADVKADEAWLLASRHAPIVLLARRASEDLAAGNLQGARLSERIAPGNDFVGVLLPYTPLHQLLLEGMPPLVMTSGNVSEEPIAKTNREAADRLAGIADGFLFHDREIETACDDSVLRWVGGHPLPIRRSRGYAPLPVSLRPGVGEVLAVGGELKATACVTSGEYAHLGPHVGDMGNLETLQSMEACVEHLLRLFRVQPQCVAADQHPGYLSADWAERFARTHDIPLVRVQHHHAHVVALRTEHRVSPDEKILGVCFDGTGWGPDGTIWGGEWLVCDDVESQRVGWLQPVPLPGGDAAIRSPARVALAHLWAAGIDWDPRLPPCAAFEETQRKLLRRQLERNLNCLPTSSMGRLFDAVAALIGLRNEVGYEGQAAMELEALAARTGPGADMGGIAFGRVREGDENWIIDPVPVLDQICRQVMAGAPPKELAAAFHRAVAAMVADVTTRVCKARGLRRVGLTGGVFQNALLTEWTVAELEAAGLEVLRHQLVPPNDGGLALGQAVVAGRKLAAGVA